MTLSHVRPDRGKPCKKTIAGPLPSLRQWTDASPTLVSPSAEESVSPMVDPHYHGPARADSHDHRVRLFASMNLPLGRLRAEIGACLPTVAAAAQVTGSIERL
jgi:hypothetical protein